MFLSLFSLYCTVFKDLNAESSRGKDTFPIPACDNWRIRRKKRYTGEAYRGYDASKRRPDSGIKIHTGRLQ
ncbi:hypothetical protein HYR99_05565 [Candidatus Poribacteria bacterium]|nr:hypothetical protein [Candidatus Poribacteria bacterium]